MPALFEDGPTPEVIATFNNVFSGMASGFIQWAGQRHGPLTDTQVDAMLWRMAQAAARVATRVWADSEPPDPPVATDERWPEL